MFQSIVEAVFHYADTQPEQLCLADDTEQVTYRAYADRIMHFADRFARDGVKAGDTVVVEACQTVDYLAIELALQLLGAVFVPVEHNCAENKIAAFIQRAQAGAVIVCRQADYAVPLIYTYDQMEQLRESGGRYVPQQFPAKTQVSEILFSTGTTGKEKGIVLTHGNDIALAENVVYGVEMQKDNVEMIPSPLNHSHGLRRYYANMYNGSTVILLGSAMNIMRFMQNMDTYGVNSIDLVPSALSVVLKLSKNKLADYRDQLRYIQFGAAPMMEADKVKICELLPNTRLYNFYGSTESGCICIYNFNRQEDKKNCIGRPAHNAEIVIVDDDRREITSSESNTGCLASRGAMNMLGYWQDPEETEKVLQDGVVYSNDIAYYDEDGDIILLGRRGDVINVGGNKVSPEEIENAAKALAEVEDCGVIPVEDPYKGHVPKLFVQMKRGCDFDPVALRSALAGCLEPYKVPVYIEQIAQIPRSYNGKLLRKELKAAHQNG